MDLSRSVAMLRKKTAAAEEVATRWFGAEGEPATVAYNDLVRQIEDIWELLYSSSIAAKNIAIATRVAEVMDSSEYRDAPWKTTDTSDGPRCVYLEQAKSVVDQFDAIGGSSGAGSRPLSIIELEQVLSNCEGHITNRQVFGWVPCSEHDVHVRVEGLLKCIYADLLSKPRIPGPIKSFEPDTGIPSLGTLIEYKYAKTRDEAKEIVDQVLADAAGYADDKYHTIIFVVYETERLYPLHEWKQRVEGIAAGKDIRFILLKGVPPEEVDRARRDAVRDGS